MEFGDCGSIADSLNKESGVFSEQEIQYILASILLGITYLHEHKKIHRVLNRSRLLNQGYQGRKCFADKGWKGEISWILVCLRSLIQPSRNVIL